MNSNKLVSITFSVTLYVISVVHVPTLFAQSMGERLVNETGSLQLVLNAGEQNESRLQSHRGILGLVSIHPGQSIPFTLQFTGNRAGYPMVVGCMDGGQILSVTAQGNTLLSNITGVQENFPLSSSSARDFIFQAGQDPGLYRVLVQVPDEQYFIHFYLVAPNSP